MLRFPLVVACVLLCAQSAFADLAMTVKDIGLMLRSGYSSKAILADLATRHFTDTLDANHELYLLDLHASPELIAALKNGQYAASLQEKLARVTVPIQQADEAKRMTQQAADRQAEERQQLAQRKSQSQIVIAPISGQTSEFLTPSESAAKRRVEKAAEQQVAAEEAAMQPTRQQAAPSPFNPSLNNDFSNEWETKHRIRDAVEAVRREDRANAESRARGGGQVIHSSTSFSSVGDDEETRNRIQRSVEAARREDENNERAKAHGGGEIHRSSESFDPGRPW
jgi:hypothetical protein